MSEEFKKIVDSSFDNPNFLPLWIYNQDYIYGIIPADPNGQRWIEISYTFEEDEPFMKSERNSDLSFQFLFEELEKGISFYTEDFNVNKLKSFVKTLEAKSGTEKIKSLINELINNCSNFSKNLPIIKNKNELNKLKEKL